MNIHPRIFSVLLGASCFLSTGLALAQQNPPPAPALPVAGKIALSWLDVTRAVQTWGRPGKNLGVTGKPLGIGGQAFDNGFGTHSHSRLFVRLGGKAARFSALVGVDDTAGAAGSVEFRVVGDGKTLWSSGVMRRAQPPKPVSVDVAGVQHLTLEVTDRVDGNSFDHAETPNKWI